MQHTSPFRADAAVWLTCVALSVLVVSGLVHAEDVGRPVRESLSAAVPADALQAIARHEERIVAVGSKGLVLESANGGEEFLRTQLPGRAPLIGVTVCPDGKFFLLDFRSGLWARDTPDSPWSRQLIENELEDRPKHRQGGARLLDLQCDPEGDLWAVGEYSSILRSKRGGTQWRRMLPDRSDRLLTAVGFVGPGRARVVGEFGAFLSTEDGGENWRVGPAVEGDLYPHAATFAEDGRSWVVGNTGAVFRLDPRATAWVREEIEFSGALYGVSKAEDMLVVGAGGFAGLREEGAPPRWVGLATEPPRGVARDLRGLVQISDGSFLAAGSAGLIRLRGTNGNR